MDYDFNSSDTDSSDEPFDSDTNAAYQPNVKFKRDVRADGTDSVSYTHLDVYKRQDPNNPNENSTAYENVLAMINAITTDQLKFTSVHYKDNGQDIIAFEGNCFDAYDNLQKTQAIERKSSDSILNNRLSVLNQIANSKDAVSGVYMDEEVMNLMRYQQSYNAAARLMTTLDEALNTLINNTGIVGR